jgi:hypothetical protein
MFNIMIFVVLTKSAISEREKKRGHEKHHTCEGLFTFLPAVLICSIHISGGAFVLHVG